jgi:uncharacterized membrane protein
MEDNQTGVIPEDPQAAIRRSKLNKFTMFRPAANGASAQWLSPDAHVVAMIGAAINSVATAFDKKFWPQLDDIMTKAVGPQEFEENTYKAYEAFYKFVERSTDKENTDTTFMEALEAVGWNEVPATGQVAYISMISYYFMSRFWVACRQQLALGVPPAKVFNQVAENAGEVMRLMAGNIDPQSEAVLKLARATQFAIDAGLTSATIQATIASSEVAARLT